MWNYEKRLQFPVRISKPNAAAAKVIITQFGGLKNKKIYYFNIRKSFLPVLCSYIVNIVTVVI